MLLGIIAAVSVLSVVTVILTFFSSIGSATPQKETEENNEKNREGTPNNERVRSVAKLPSTPKKEITPVNVPVSIPDTAHKKRSVN